MLNSFQILSLWRGERERERENMFKLSLRSIGIDRFDFSNYRGCVMNSQYHLLHAKRYLGASVASSIKHYHHHHHWHHHQKAPSLPPALTTTRCYSPSVSLSPSSKKKRKEKTFLPPLGIGVLSLFVSISLSLSPALALFPEISTICTFTPSPSLLPRPFRHSCTILVSIARMQKACSFVPSLSRNRVLFVVLIPLVLFVIVIVVIVVVVFVVATLCSTCGWCFLWRITSSPHAWIAVCIRIIRSFNARQSRLVDDR